MPKRKQSERLTDESIGPDPRVYRPHDLILRGDGHRALDRQMDEAIASWPIARFPPEIQEQCDRHLREGLVSDGEAAFSVGMPIESCPDFVDSDMGVYWQIGWQTAWQKREDEKTKRAMDLLARVYGISLDVLGHIVR